MKDSGERTDEKRLAPTSWRPPLGDRERGTEAIAHPAEDRDPEEVGAINPRLGVESAVFKRRGKGFSRTVERHSDRVCR